MVLDQGALYDADYYEHRLGAIPYRKGEEVWEGHFGRAADQIVSVLRPKRVFDAGCALGFLVEALWDRGVEAYGRDISSFAISQIREDVRPNCAVGSIADPIEGRYDVITNIEVLEHLPAALAVQAIERFTEATDTVLFSSTSTDFDEPTHVNVRPTIYWIREFASHGFAPDAAFDAAFISPQALLFRRANGPIPEEQLTAAAEVVRLRLMVADHIAIERQRTDALAAPSAMMESVGTGRILATLRRVTDQLGRPLRRFFSH